MRQIGEFHAPEDWLPSGAHHTRQPQPGSSPLWRQRRAKRRMRLTTAFTQATRTAPRLVPAGNAQRERPELRLDPARRPDLRAADTREPLSQWRRQDVLVAALGAPARPQREGLNDARSPSVDEPSRCARAASCCPAYGSLPPLRPVRCDRNAGSDSGAGLGPRAVVATRSVRRAYRRSLAPLRRSDRVDTRRHAQGEWG